jgi:hypothetical protein
MKPVVSSTVDLAEWSTPRFTASMKQPAIMAINSFESGLVKMDCYIAIAAKPC